jgi:hypothetical protein
MPKAYRIDCWRTTKTFHSKAEIAVQTTTSGRAVHAVLRLSIASSDKTQRCPWF